MTSESSSKFRAEARRRKRYRETIMHIVLLLIMFMYSFLGAKLFQSIEEKHEETATGNLIQSKHEFLNSIAEGIGSEKLDKGNWTMMVERLLNYYVEDLAEATSHGVDITDVSQHEYESAKKWDFWGSLFYAGTVYTTIGYGNFAPVTNEGKIATIVYGTIGIPLCLILLADLGNLIAKLVKHGVKKVKKQIYAGTKRNLRELWPPQDDIDAMSGRASFVVLCWLCALYLFLGALMYRSWEEDWSYLDAVYFIFVSTSTIGFGDVLPSQPKKFIFTSLYIFFGLSLLSAVFTVLQDLLESQITDYTGSIDHALGIQQMEAEKKSSTSSTPTEERTTPKLDTSTTSMTSSTSSERYENNNNSTTVRQRPRPTPTITPSIDRTPTPTITPSLDRTILNSSSTTFNTSTTTESQPEPFVEKKNAVDQVDSAKPIAAVEEMPVVVEESIVTQSVNNNTMSAPPSTITPQM